MKKEVLQYINAIEHKQKRLDAKVLADLMEQESGYRPYLSGSIVRFGRYHYKYESGHEGDAIVTGFSPRKQHIVVYIMPGFSKFEKDLEKLGKHKLGKSCLYLNKLTDVDLKVLARIVNRSVKLMAKMHDCQAP